MICHADCTFYPRYAFVGAIAIFASISTHSILASELYGAPPSGTDAYLDKLVKSYPDWIQGHDNEYLTMKTGAKFAISDHKVSKSFDELVEHPDLDDMFFIPYPAGTEPKQPRENFDPGRVRFEPLFVAMYGDCKKSEVASKLQTIDWLPVHGGGRVAITSVNGVDRALAAVSRELDEAPAAFIKFLRPTVGTYNCRTVAGSGVRSMHSYGAAIDLNTKYADYWRWSSIEAPGMEKPISNRHCSNL